MKRKNKNSPPEIPPKVVFDTFRDMTGYSLTNLAQHEPTCFNGYVNARKFRITVELVEDSPDEQYARLIQLWRACDNYHHYDPLQNAAKTIGRELPHAEFGKFRKQATG